MANNKPEKDNGEESQGEIMKRIKKWGFIVEELGGKITAIIPRRRIAKIRKLIEELSLKELEELIVFIRDKIKEKKQE